MRNTGAAIIKSPLLHFIILGLIAFALYIHLKPPEKEVIRVTTQTIDALVQQHESITRNPVNDEQKQNLVEGYLEDEILLREAYKRGIDKNDYRVRKRLLSVMRSSLLEVVPQPTTAQLRAFYDDNKDRYKTSPSISFKHVYFSFAGKKTPTDPEQFVTILENSDDIAKLGDLSMMGNTFSKASFTGIARNFGKPFAESIFELPLNKWSGPVESFVGFHYVRLTGRHDPELPRFEKMESYLRTDYLMEKSRASVTRKIDEMSKGYKIVVEGAETE